MMSVKKAKSNGDMNILTSSPLKSEVTRDSRSPFVHKFQTPLKKYILDVNTNRILCVDAVTWDIADDFGVLEKADIIRKYSDKYELSEISSAYEGIKAAQEHNNLLPRSFELAALPDLKEFRDSIENKRRKLTLCLTKECNFKCKGCVYYESKRSGLVNSGHNLSWEVARKGIDDYISHSNGSHKDEKFIAFYGGEPLLVVELLKQCVRYARERLREKVAFDIITNGSMLIGKSAEFLAAEGFSMQVVLDGPSHIHDHNRIFENGSGTFDIVTRNIQDFVDKYPEYKKNGKLEITAHLSPFGSFIELENFFCSQFPSLLHCYPYVWLSKMLCWDPCYIDYMYIPDYHAIPGREILYKSFMKNAKDNLINQNPDNPKWIIQRYLFENLIRCFLTRAIASPEVPFLDGRSRLDATCTPTWFNYFMNVDGNYFLCDRVLDCEEFKIGDVWNGVDYDKSYTLKKKYIELSGNECECCWCVNFCHIGCYALVRDGQKITAEAKQRACDQYRKNTHCMLTDLFEVLEANPHAFDYLKRTKHVADKIATDEM